MNVKKLYRICIVTSLVLLQLGIIYSQFIFSPESKEIEILFSWDGYGGLLYNRPGKNSSGLNIFLLPLFLVAIVAYLAGIIGMYFFKRWARTTIVILTIASFIYYLFMGIIVSLPSVILLHELSTFLTGIFICMAYLPPLNKEFITPKKDPTP